MSSWTSTILVWPLYYIFNFCLSNGVCPSVWLSSYLLPLYILGGCPFHGRVERDEIPTRESPPKQSGTR